ncbi:MAG: hypothetical protein JWO82_2403, partial [Akkermansiaceae bacterium]|nr:hypothetical protein [Akkermansiaceae bacterium]
LVRRHLGLVRATARRQVGPDLAEDATQMVFAILARKAGSLTGLRSLAAWLHRVTVLQCRSMVRGQIRERRKQESAMETARLAEARDPLEEALPFLDAAICDLPDKDRELIHLRYSEGLSFTEAARRTGRSEVALRQQASRALGKLQALLKGRGVAVPATALAAGLGATLGGGSTASAATLVAAGALASSAAVGGGWLAWITFFTMTTKQGIVAGAALAVLLVAGPLAWRAHEIREAGHATAGGTSSTAGIVAGESSGGGGAPEVKARPGRGKGGPAAAAADPEEEMMKVAEVLAAEVQTGMKDWLEQTAEIEAGRTGRALNLSPPKREALRKLLSDQAAAEVKKGLNFDDEEDAAAKARRLEEDKAALEAWYAANLTPEEAEARQRMEQARQAATVEKLASEALYGVSSVIPLTEEQKTALYRAAAAKATEAVEHGEPARSMNMGLSVSAGAPVPVEEISADLLDRVLDPAQQELWRQTVKRDEIFQQDLPKRLLEHAMPILKAPEMEETLKDLIPGEPEH